MYFMLNNVLYIFIYILHIIYILYYVYMYINARKLNCNYPHKLILFSLVLICKVVKIQVMAFTSLESNRLSFKSAITYVTYEN